MPPLLNHPTTLIPLAADTAVGGLGALLVIVVVGSLYFLPTIIAVVRKLRSIGPTAVVNLFLGWTFIGWIVALAMAFGQTKDDSWVGGAASVRSSTLYAPDGRSWWDGTGWRPLPTSDPTDAETRSDPTAWSPTPEDV